MELTSVKPAQSFRDLHVWQSAYALALEIYKICETFPKHERYALADQMCSAAVSVCSNIAEGFGRRSLKEKDQFYSIANGSLTELENQLLIAHGVDYIQAQRFHLIMEQCETTHRMLVTLQRVNKMKGARS